ncbi:hypothetical protein RYZ47_24100, partial [Escherichia coli]|nr:hypothetical protein [Escherichia coli]
MSFMVFVTCLTIAFVAGFAVARKLTLRKVASSVIITKSQPVPSSATSPAAKASTRSYTPQKTYRDSRWQERDELFQGMVAEGILLEGKEGNDSNLLIVFYVQIMPDDLVMQLHR